MRKIINLLMVLALTACQSPAISQSPTEAVAAFDRIADRFADGTIGECPETQEVQQKGVTHVEAVSRCACAWSAVKSALTTNQKIAFVTAYGNFGELLKPGATLASAVSVTQALVVIQQPLQDAAPRCGVVLNYGDAPSANEAQQAAINRQEWAAHNAGKPATLPQQ